MLHPSTKRLIDKLSEMTRKQRVSWSEGENGTITHDTEGYRVVLTSEPHAVLLTDALGKEIESCTPDEFADDTDSSGRPYAAFVADLYREASRHARGTERAISTLLKGLETMDEAPAAAPDPAHDPEDLIEDLGDDTEALPEAYPELEGQTDMARAVASMADEVNSGAAAPDTDTDDEGETELAAEAELAGAGMDVIEPEPETPVYAEPETETVFEAEDDAEDDTGHDMPVPDEPAETAGSGTHEAPAPLWPADEKQVHAGTATGGMDHDEAPAMPDDDVQRPIPAVGAGFFGSSLGNLSQYHPEPAPATPEPEAETVETAEDAPEAADTAEPEPAFGHFTPASDETGPALAEEAAPATESAPEPEPEPAPAPVAPRHFSLSGISSGFGLGSAGRTGSPSEDTSPPASFTPATPSAERPHIVIDGTVDLPDDAVLDAFDADPDAPAYPEPLSARPEGDFRFSETAAAHEAHAAPVDTAPPAAEPEEQAFEAPAAAERVEAPAEPEEDESPESAPAPKVTTRFNPWN